MGKVFNKVQQSTTKEMRQSAASVSKLTSNEKFDNAAAMEQVPGEKKITSFDILKDWQKKNAVKLAAYCLAEAEGKNISLFREYLKAKEQTKGFSIIYTESENKDNTFTEFTSVKNSKGETRVFWHKVQEVSEAKDILRAFAAYRRFAEALRIQAKEQKKLQEIEDARNLLAGLELTDEQIQAIALLKKLNASIF